MSLDTTLLLWQDITKIASKLKVNSYVIAVDAVRLQSINSQSTVLSHAMVVLLQPCGKGKDARNLAFKGKVDSILKDLGTTIRNYKEIADDTWVVTLASATSLMTGQLLITFREEA